MRKTFVRPYNSFWNKFVEVDNTVNYDRVSETIINKNNLVDSTQVNELKVFEITEFQTYLVKNRCLICLKCFKNDQIVYHTVCHFDLWYHEDCFSIHLKHELGCPVCRLPFLKVRLHNLQILDEL